MNINESVLQKSEAISLKLRSLYASAGYAPYRMSKFEEYDLYARNKEFLVSDNVITFTDTSGKLMALKPDVTLSIIKNTPDVSFGCEKVYYNENVYRVSQGTGEFKELLQTGLECIGALSVDDECGVLTLAVESLKCISERFLLDVSDLNVLTELITLCGIRRVDVFYQAFAEKNLPLLTSLLEEEGSNQAASDAAKTLLSLHGAFDEVRGTLESLSYYLPSLSRFIMMLSHLPKDGVSVDFSVVIDTNYYNGIVFRGFVEGVPQPVLSGGRYDKLLRKLRRTSNATGFAVYLDALEHLDEERVTEAEPTMLNIALPKGRLGEKIYDIFEKAGFECPSIREPNRKLIFENREAGVRYFWVKPSDVAIYVDRGAADIGVAGKDILLEYEPDVYELLDTGKGVCRMAVAAPKGFADDKSKTLRVATKFTNIAKSYYRSLGRDIDIIHLNGSIEIAPILGLSDVIVDIVETGATLKENNLEVVETVVPISARLIANKASFKFKSAAIEKLIAAMDTMLKEEAGNQQ